MSDLFERQRRRAVESLAKRVKERDQSDTSVDAEMFALEFVTALCGQGWRPVEALQPPPEPPTAPGPNEAFRQAKAAIAARIETTPEGTPE